jgi:hypothetical protein
MGKMNMMNEIKIKPCSVTLSSGGSPIEGRRFYLLPFFIHPLPWYYLQLVGAPGRNLSIDHSFFLLSALFTSLQGEVSFSWAILIDVLFG